MKKQIVFRPFRQQIDFLQDPARIRGAFAGKRGGKTEVGAVETLRCLHEKRGWKPSPIDPYTGIIIAPTSDMLRRLSLAKFLAYSNGYRPPGAEGFNQTKGEGKLLNNAVFHAISGDKPKRMEGVKANVVWIDEVFQVKEQVFLEAMARVADQEGFIICTGSLGVDYPNPKAHWAYKYFKQRPLQGSKCFEWATAENPYFPKAELQRLKETLDPVTFRQMFTLTWDGSATNRVYEDFDEPNLIQTYTVRRELETYIAVDWGFAHPAAVGFFQYDRVRDVVYQFDEIVGSRLLLEQLADRIFAKIKAHGIRVNEWVCDIAGTQEREQTGLSNIKWFKDNKGISFRYRTSGVGYGISVVRSYIKNTVAARRFYVVEPSCPKTVDAMKNYHYAEKDGAILNENPVKKDDDPCDMVRYFFMNVLDRDILKPGFEEMSRWGKTW